MPRLSPALRRPRVYAPVLVLLLLALALGLRAAVMGAVAGRIRHAAAERGLVASWQTLRIAFPADVTVLGLALAGAAGDVAFHAESLRVEVNPWSLLALRPGMRSVSLSHARAWMRASRAADPDTLVPDEPRTRDHGRRERAERLRASAEHLVALLLAPARDFPRLALRDVSVIAPHREDALSAGARLAWLELRPMEGGVRLAANGSLLLERPIPFEVGLDYGRDDRIAGGARFRVPALDGRGYESLRIALDGRVAQDRRTGVVRLADSTRVTIGRLPFLLSGSLERRGPRVRFALAADHITPGRLIESIPGAVLGPLLGLSVRGEFDYRLSLDLDLARPDSVEFAADVIPNHLALDPGGTRLRLFGLDEPFTAVIHLPHGVIATRDLSPASPSFRPLDAMDSLLVHAVVTNEDGGFFHHRGFNIEAVKMAIAENLKAGAFRRGAGTITMQLARNLYLGHERTLARKAQEVVLAWVLEHLTGVSKRRLLEIYLNIIEWGPGVHGADEATRYYLGHDAGRVSVGEALFLSTVVPSPGKWRYRFDRDGGLQPFARAQMHFIGRAMIAKGWLSPEDLPPADSLRVELEGPAREVLFPPADSLGNAAQAPTGEPT